MKLVYATGNDYINGVGAMTTDLLSQNIQIVYPGKVYVSVLASQSKDATITINYSITDVNPTADWTTTE